ncbi:MAG: branched-chain amino acid transaminase [Terracidiphilus sp.]
MQSNVDPKTIVYFNGKYMPLGDARVGILTHALNYGTGVFEGIRAHWDEAQQELFVMRPVEHYQRWKQNCGFLRIVVPPSPEELSEITLELMRRNVFRTNVYVRPLAYKSAERIGVSYDDQDSFAVVALPFGDYLPTDRGLHAGVSSWRRIDDNAIPARGKICGAYVNSALASDEAHRCGFDDAIFLNESGHVAEGAACNIFMVRKGKLITPPVTENILEGITRDAVMELAHRELGLEVVERPIDRSELYVCDELFFTGTAVGIAPVTQVDHHPVKDGNIGMISRELQKVYFDATRGHLQAYWNWLAPVYNRAMKNMQGQDAPAELVAG